jgi:2-polyprenyl-6-methoxyphenol hydroxylase-like FAD-dependent oxidoreductase
MKVAVAGGGPAGLLVAYLLKKNLAGCQVRVWEQNPRDATFGFGVVLADGGLRNIAEAAPEIHDDIVARAERLAHQTIRHRGEAIVVDRTRLGANIGRLELLSLLQARCREAGVELAFESRADDPAALGWADLIVGADGVNSAIRTALADRFGTTIRHLGNRFCWYGAARRYDGSALSFKSVGDRVFIAHYYRYAPDMSTFVVECDARTWIEEGLGDMAEDDRRALVEQVFAEELGGHRLVTNNSIWRQFPVVRNERWFVDNVVLLGDALRSVHFSIGSGTRVALDDAIFLFQALRSHPGDVGKALSAFEVARRPIAEKLTGAAERSYEWYENIRPTMQQLGPLDFVYDFMTRTGRMNDERLRRDHPRFMAHYEARRGGGRPAAAPQP